MKTKTPFSKLSKAEKRIVILKDALKHLKADRIRADIGHVLKIQGDICDFKGEELQAVLKKQKTCTVCVRGGMLFSMVWRLDKFKLGVNTSTLRGTAGEGSQDDKYLRKIFTINQLMMMERAFEGQYHDRREFTYVTGMPYLPNDVADKCKRFCYGRSPHERFEAILKNAIKNKGIFKP